MELIDKTEPLVITNHGRNRRCDFCHVEEGKPRVIGRYIVQLRSVNVFGVEKLACQTCFRKDEKILASRKHDHEKSKSGRYNISFSLKRVISKILTVFAFIL